MNDLITVIVPIYNAEKSIAQCIESILSQEYKKLEILLINDGSTDNSLLICKEFAKRDSRIRIIDKANSGVSATRNLGIKNARGEYIAFVDADDTIDQTMYSKMHEKATSTSADLVFCYYYEKTGLTYRKKKEEMLKRVVQEKDLTPLFLMKDNVMGSVWRVLIKSELCRKVSFNESIKLEEDKLFMLEVITQAKKIALTEDCLYYYSINGELSKYYSESIVSERKTLYKCEEKYFERLPIDVAKAEKYRIYLKTALNLLYNSKTYRKDMRRINKDPFFKEARRWTYLKSYMAVESAKEGIKALFVRIGLYSIVKYKVIVCKHLMKLRARKKNG